MYPTHTPYSTLPSLLHKPSLTLVLVRFPIAETIRSWTQAYPVNYSASPQRRAFIVLIFSPTTQNRGPIFANNTVDL